MSELSQYRNDQVASFSLPDIDALNYERLHPDYRWVMLIARVISLFILLGILVIASLVLVSQELGAYTKYIFTGYGIIALFRLGFVFIAYKRKGFALRKRDVIYKEGVLYYRWVALPYDRVQHAEVHAGLMERLFELSSLRIYTAGGSSSDLSIPGLKPDQALKMRSFILKRAGGDEEE